jgi:hypothetical protein
MNEFPDKEDKEIRELTLQWYSGIYFMKYKKQIDDKALKVYRQYLLHYFPHSEPNDKRNEVQMLREEIVFSSLAVSPRGIGQALYVIFFTTERVALISISHHPHIAKMGFGNIGALIEHSLVKNDIEVIRRQALLSIDRVLNQSSDNIEIMKKNIQNIVCNPRSEWETPIISIGYNEKELITIYLSPFEDYWKSWKEIKVKGKKVLVMFREELLNKLKKNYSAKLIIPKKIG